MGKRHLGAAERLWLAGEIQRLLGVARAVGRPEAKWADNLIRNAYLWYWTADGIGEDGEVTRDLLKTDADFLRHTKAAWLALQEGRKVIHEHAVPRKVLLKHLKEATWESHAQIKGFLDRFCFGVLIDRASEHPRLSPWKESMPTKLTESSDPLERYRHAEISVLDPQNARTD